MLYQTVKSSINEFAFQVSSLRLFLLRVQFLPKTFKVQIVQQSHLLSVRFSWIRHETSTINIPSFEARRETDEWKWNHMHEFSNEWRKTAEHQLKIDEDKIIQTNHIRQRVPSFYSKRSYQTMASDRQM